MYISKILIVPSTGHVNVAFEEGKLSRDIIK
jgi:hypothetical protein